MKARLHIFILFISFSGFLFAKHVPIEKAKLIAKNFYYEMLSQDKAVKYNSITATEVYTGTRNNTDLYYVFNINQNQGYVIVTSDDILWPVIACSLEGAYIKENLPPAMVDFMKIYENQIDYCLQSKANPTAEISTKWKELDYSVPNKIIKRERAIKTLLLTHFQQSSPYNIKCPADPAPECDGHALVGCVAISMGQVMKYYNYPTKGNSSKSYNHPNYGTLSANFGNTTYNWSNIPFQSNEKNDDLALLLSHCGISVSMGYACDGSGASISSASNALKNYFKYSSSTGVKQKSSYTEANWVTLLKNELDQKRPMIYSGSSDASGGHAWNCDGYTDPDYFHMNWGWGGSADGYFYLTSLNPSGQDLNEGQSAITGIYPTGTYPVYCTGTKTISGTVNGSIEDGSANKDYQNNMDCRYLITPSCGNIITLSFDKFTVDTTDSIIIYNGDVITDPVLLKLSGKNTKPSSSFTANNGNMLIRFITDGAKTNEGWAVTYSVKYCEGTATVTTNSGTIADGSGTCDYLEGKLCTYMINPAVADYINIDFTAFNLSYNKHYVKLYENTTLKHNFTSDNVPSGTYVIKGPIVKVTFSTTSKDGTVGDGWSLNYTTSTSVPEINENKMTVSIYPNPFIQDASISYELPENGPVSFTIYDLLGKQIAAKTIKETEGSHTMSLSEIAKLRPGIYFISVTTEQGVATKKITVM